MIKNIYCVHIRVGIDKKALKTIKCINYYIVMVPIYST